MFALIFTAAALAIAAPQASARTTQSAVSYAELADLGAQTLTTENPFTAMTLSAPDPAPEIALPSVARPRTKRSILVVIMGSLCFLTGMLNVRSLKDANLSVTKALPAAAAANYSDVLDLKTALPGRTAQPFELSITLPATPALVDAKTITLTLKDSADGVTFAAVADLPPIVSTGAGGVGAAAIDRRFKPPIGLQRYLRLDAAVLAAGGDNTAVSTTLALVF